MCKYKCAILVTTIQGIGVGSVMVWGGISMEGRTNLSRLGNGIWCQDEILGPCGGAAGSSSCGERM